MRQEYVLEACCESVAAVYAAKRAGADRIELTTALALGGLTPGVGMVKAARGAGLPVMAMVRPRGGGFCYSKMEFESMLYDTQAMLDAGAEGIVFGILREDGTVDRVRCEILLAHIGNAQSVFHRAIDVTPDWTEAMDVLCELGVRRILSSGQALSAPEGLDTLRGMVAYASGRIELMAGSGIRLQNAVQIVQQTGCTQLHASLFAGEIDSSLSHKPAFEAAFGAGLGNGGMNEEQFAQLSHLVRA